MSAVIQTNQPARIEAPAAGVSLLLIAAIIGIITAHTVQQDFTPRRASHGAALRIDPGQNASGHAAEARDAQIRQRFDQAVMMLHAGQYDFAITALHRVIELSPRMPEAYVNMGYALIGKQNHKAARDFFNAAIELRPYQANAYWGLAVTSEKLGDLEGALGAMRAYIHLTPPDQNSEPYLRKARAALWEWETTLKRGPLPPEEVEWLARRGKEWTERNSPAADAPQQADRGIAVSPVK